METLRKPNSPNSPNSLSSVLIRRGALFKMDRIEIFFLFFIKFTLSIELNKMVNWSRDGNFFGLFGYQ